MNFTSLRRARGYTRRNRLAAVSGVGMSALSQIEAGKIKSPRYETVSKLAAALGAPIAEVATAIEVQFSEGRHD